MLETLLPWFAIGAGFLGLLWSSHHFVEGSAAVAQNLGVPKLIIGLTIVAMGTSAPEVIVSISSALNNASELAVGNALGSNLANIGLVLGATALIAPLPIKGHILKQEFPLMLALMLIAGGFLWDGILTMTEGTILVALIVPVLFWFAYAKKQQPEEDDDEISAMATPRALFWFLVGLVAMIFSAEILVYGAKVIALRLGVSPLIVGLTVVALGTSLPELAASISSALKGHHDIAIGNVIGSNIFNLLLVMGIPAIIKPIALEASVFTRDYMAMTALTLLLGTAMAIRYFKSSPAATKTNTGVKTAGISRFTGVLLLLAYGVYYVVLFGQN